MSDSAGNPSRADADRPSPALSESQDRDPSVSNDEVSKLVAACQQGERDAQRTLFERFHCRVFRLAVRTVGQEDAPDLTQQIFLQMFQTIGQFAGRSRFDTWLYRVAFNECLQHLRRRKANVHQPLLHEPVSRERAHTTQLEQQELIEEALGRLEPDLRAIFLLREVEGQNYAEIAESLEISEGTVASRLNRARRRLKDHLVDLGWEPF